MQPGDLDESCLPADDLLREAPGAKRRRPTSPQDDESMFERTDDEEEGEEQELGRSGEEAEPREKTRRFNELGRNKGKQWKHWEREMDENIQECKADVFEILSPPRASMFMKRCEEPGKRLAFDLTMKDDDGEVWDLSDPRKGGLIR